MNSKSNLVGVYASVIVGVLFASGAAQAQIIGGSGQAIGGIGGAFSGGPRAASGAFGGGVSGAGQLGADSFGASRIRRDAFDRTQATAGKVGSTARNDATMSRRAAAKAKQRANSELTGASAQASSAADYTGNFTEHSANSSAQTAHAIPSAAKAPALEAASQGEFSSGARANRGTLETLGATDAGTDTAMRNHKDTQTRAPTRSLAPEVEANGNASGEANVRRDHHGMPRANSSADANGSVSASR